MRKLNYFYNNQIILLRVYRTIVEGESCIIKLAVEMYDV
jgi:hypothetical protein